MKIIGTNEPIYEHWRNENPEDRNNGAYWYAREIEDIILPALENLDVTVVTVAATQYTSRQIPDGSAVICHNNRTTIESYSRFFNKNILWICSKHSTVNILKEAGENAVYIPLSIDTQHVSKFKTSKTKDIAYVGNPWGFKESYLKSLPKNIAQLNGLERDDLLAEMAKYKRVIAEGRCLMEAQVLGAKGEVPVYPEGHEAVFVKPVDSREVIPQWREALQQAV